jgi:hypothetical protein
MDMLVSVQWKIGEANIQLMFVTVACHLGSFYEFIDHIILHRIIQQITGQFMQHIDFDKNNLIH